MINVDVVLSSMETEIQVKLLAKDKQGVVFMELKCHRFYYILSSVVNSLKKWFICFWLNSPPVGHGLIIHEVSRSHTTTHHSRDVFCGRVINSSQRPLPNNTQHSKQRNVHVPVGFKPTILAAKRPQTYSLDRVASRSNLNNGSNINWNEARDLLS